MICQVCGARLMTEDCCTAAERVPCGDREEEVVGALLCPVCGNEAVSEGGECAECGGEFPRTELDCGLCRMCVSALNESLDWMWEQFSDAQKQWAVARPEWMER